MRCKWCNLDNPVYVKYHDEEWGVLNLDEHYLFEMLILESFQAGLSWECVLNKRDAFRKAYDNFEIEKVIKYDDIKINELINNKDIIRNNNPLNIAIEQNGKKLTYKDLDEKSNTICLNILKSIQYMR